MNKFAVEDKVCLIVGGLSTLGVSLADFVHSRSAKVWITDTLSDPEGKEILSGKYKERWGYSTLDVRNKEQFEEAFEKCCNEFGRPDILFNLTQIFGENDWSNIYDVNVKGAYLGIELGMKFMNKSHNGNGGVVLNISSFVGVSCRGDHFAATPAFTSSQHAITALTRTFGSELYFERSGVRILSVVPYYFEGSKMVENGFEALTSDLDARKHLQEAVKGKKFLTGEEASLKIINVLNAKNGSVWFIRPHQLQPINIPDNRLPN
uniref:15-hydroxyprostaglandin dehydrogenase [NAD(+)] n=1 Tax=Lepeophtheirus salmonis TaxID=72036 RepID=D3PGX4_LEPSM|nr:15-hydroxyprostaglandin dehydrogenase [Lepeophtheirus salmonis]